MRRIFDAILFDIDGTLVDSTSAVERTWRTWAARRGIDPALILRDCHGRRSEDTVAQFVPPDEVASAVAELTRLELADLADVTALPGARDLLTRLPASRWAAVTSGPPDLMRARLAIAGLPAPEVLVTSADVTAGKPDPEGYLAAAAALSVRPERCLVVEDAPAGIAAGHAAGATVLGVATSHDAGALTGADAVIADLTRCAIEQRPGGLTVAVAP